MKIDQITAQAVELRNQGMSLRRIAEELGGISKSTIERKLKAYDEFQDNNEPVSLEETELETDYSGIHKPTKQQTLGQDHTVQLAHIGLGKVKLTLAHEAEMEDKKLRKMQLEIKERKQTLKERELEIQQEAEELRYRQRAEKIHDRKNYLLRKFHKLVKELQESCDGYEWDIESEVIPYLTRTQNLQSEIEQLCTKLSIDHEELAIWDTLDLIITTIDEMLEENDDRFIPKRYLEFDLAAEDDDELSLDDLSMALQIGDFDEIVEDIEEDDEDELWEDDLQVEEDDQDY